MAMIAVQIVLEKLASLMTEEAQLLGGVRRGVDELRDDLESMQSFLRDAEARSESDHGVKTWVKQVRDVAYDTEDVLEEFLLRFSLPHQHGFIHCLQNSYKFIQQVKARHQLAVRIQQIRERVKAISERRNAFSLNKVDEATSSDVTLGRRHYPQLASLYIDEADIVGIEKPKSLLIKRLVEGDQKLATISVVGMGGLGKTTMVKKVFDSQPVKITFDCHAWVTVSKSFTMVELLRAALKGFLKKTKEPARKGIDTMGDFQLVDALRNHLQQKRYVIVFDDVWSIDAWEAVKYALPDYNCWSRIIFTTRSNDVAASIDTNGYVYHLQPLAEKEAWALFCMKTFRGEHQGACPAELEEMSLNILKKCEGLPLAIVAIGGLFSKKNNNVLEWKKVHDSLAAKMKEDYNLESLGKILLLSYNDLPYYLKSCYLYLSVFPEDYLIKRTKLIRLWVVEKFVEEKQGLTMFEVAEDYLNELVSRSMIQVVEMDYFNRIKTCRVHDLMREIIQSKSKEESLAMILNERSTALNEKVRRLSIHDSCEGFSSHMRFPYLRSLLLFIRTESYTSSGNAFFYGFRLLRVLDLESAPLSEFPPELIDLIQLRYLSLGRTLISKLPESIGKLKNLEILDLKKSFVSSLPVGILRLKHLCELRNYHYRFGSSIFFTDICGMRVPEGIGRLTSLQKLGSVEVNGDSKIVRELGKLTQLRRLGVIKLREEDGIELCSSLQKMKQLTTLYMVSTSRDELLPLKSLLSPPQFLQHLHLKCSLPTLPPWIASLQFLVKLVLRYSHLKDDPLKALQELPSLVVFDLRLAYDGEELCCEARGYPRLKKLALFQLETLKCIRVEEGAMPELRELNIELCPKLEMLPLGIEHLKKLQELLLWCIPSTVFDSIEQSNGEDFWKIEHIQTIKRLY